MEKTHTDITTYKNKDESLIVVVTRRPNSVMTNIDIHRETATGRNEVIIFTPYEVHKLAEIFNDIIKDGNI